MDMDVTEARAFIQPLLNIQANVEGLTLNDVIAVVLEMHMQDGGIIDCPHCGGTYSISYSECGCKHCEICEEVIVNPETDSWINDGGITYCGDCYKKEVEKK